MVDVLGEHQARTGVKLLWGTANLFSHRRFMGGAGTNPDPEIFALAALQVKEALQERYAGWRGEFGRHIHSGRLSLEDLAARALERNIDVAPRSGQQEYLENLVDQFC